MEIALSLLLLCIVVLLVIGVARFLIKLTVRAVGCLISAIILLGLAAIFFLFVLPLL